MKTFKIYTGTELWQKETSLPSVPTFCQSLDNILGSDGVMLGIITELLGLPGSGKTQLCNNYKVQHKVGYTLLDFTLRERLVSVVGNENLCDRLPASPNLDSWHSLQLCASVQIPKQLGGLDAEALYIDTNTNFTLHRFREILSATLLRCQSLLNVSQTSEDEALRRLHYVNAFGLESYCSLMYKLPKFIEDHPKVKLIVIDSIAHPFKDGVSTKQRTSLLFRQMAELQRVAVENQIAVVLTNEMSTRVGLSGGSVVGALGDAWAHRCNVRLLLSTPHLSQEKNHRLALLLKSNIASSTVTSFQITADGIRDV